MSEFYNPYNFIPVTGKIGEEPSARTPYEDIRTGEHPHCRHDLWAKDTHSGRIVCRLTLETPTVVGSEQIDELGFESKRVLPYLRDGQPAIPGSSLRGMIGSVAETLSQSALRVLTDSPLKVSVWDGAKIQKRDVGKVFDYFRNIDAEILPWSFGRTEGEKRRTLTPAELLLGVVEEQADGENANQEAATNLASRLRFSDGLPVSGKFFGLDAETPLKILSSPKPPCPAMYFHKPTDNDEKRSYIAKRDLNPARHLPNGRKIYLHHPSSSVEEGFWRSEIRTHDDQKLRCTPIRPRSEFFFHVDFDNLTAAELTLLLFSLRPDRSFRHRLGLGKPLGLGRVLVAPEGIFFIDRNLRYGRESLVQPRYHGAWRFRKPEDTGELAAAYPEEAACLDSDLARFGAPTQPPFFDCDKTLIDKRTLQLLCTVADSGQLKPGVKVHTPLTEDQAPEAEGETFRWFVTNERRDHQALPLIQPGKTLPVLQRNRWKK